MVDAWKDRPRCSAMQLVHCFWRTDEPSFSPDHPIVMSFDSVSSRESFAGTYLLLPNGLMLAMTLLPEAIMYPITAVITLIAVA